MTKETFGQRVKRLRQERRLEPADILPSSYVFPDAEIGFIERGERIPTIEMAKEIADRLGVSLDYLAEPFQRQPATNN